MRRAEWLRETSLAFAFSAAVLSGCGGGDANERTVPVSGTLTVEGKPVAKGTIHFHPAKGRPASGIVKDGKFTLSTYGEDDGVIPGKNKVALDVVEEVPTKDGDTTSKSLIAISISSPSP